ncbi:MAG: NAD(P)H-dependent oxidoreductase [Acaryochloridaceae cyanobacterium SU_2_1]|nr:NAD(P)H-dependent oxidoreductase [Acaryochloridaceae cyanobacterium SU_2_1]
MSNTLLSPEQLLQQLQWRYATKQFDPSQKIPDQVWDALEQSLVLAPSSFGLQPWKFFVVVSPEVRQSLLPHSWGQTQVVDASHLVVLAIKKDVNAADVDRFMARTAEVRQVEIASLAGYANVIKGFLENPKDPAFDVNDWAARQVYIALGQLMTSAALLGIDTCPIEGFLPDQYDQILGLAEQGYGAIVVCALGYRHREDKYALLPKVRFKPTEMIGVIES